MANSRYSRFEEPDPAELELNELSWLPDPEVLARVANDLDAGTIELPQADLLCSGLGDLQLLYPGKVHTLVGEAGQGKGWLALLACAQVIHGGGKVLYLDFEDDMVTFAGRLLAAGVGVKDIVERCYYARPDTLLPPGTLDRMMEDFGPFRLAVLDGLTEAFAVMQMDDWREVALFLNTLVRPLKDSGAAVLQIDHPVKNAENRGRYAAGGHTKLGGIDAQYGVEAQVTFSKEKDGYSHIVKLKDRHGGVPGDDYQIIGRLDVTAEDGPHKLVLSSLVDEKLYAGQVTAKAGTPLPHSMQVVSEVLELAVYRNDGLPISRLRDAVKGYTSGTEDDGQVDVEAALESLVQREFVQEYVGPRSVNHFRYARKYREDVADQQKADLGGALLRADDPTY